MVTPSKIRMRLNKSRNRLLNLKNKVNPHAEFLVDFALAYINEPWDRVPDNTMYGYLDDLLVCLHVLIELYINGPRKPDVPAEFVKGIPIISASLNFTPGLSSLSSISTSTPLLISSEYILSAVSLCCSSLTTTGTTIT